MEDADAVEPVKKNESAPSNKVEVRIFVTRTIALTIREQAAVLEVDEGAYISGLVFKEVVGFPLTWAENKIDE